LIFWFSLSLRWNLARNSRHNQQLRLTSSQLTFFVIVGSALIFPSVFHNCVPFSETFNIRRTSTRNAHRFTTLSQVQNSLCHYLSQHSRRSRRDIHHNWAGLAHLAASQSSSEFDARLTPDQPLWYGRCCYEGQVLLDFSSVRQKFGRPFSRPQEGTVESGCHPKKSFPKAITDLILDF
jgi:hypothetical protein